MARLLADPRVDPGVWDNTAVQYAAFHGHDKVVALLLADPRVDPSVKNCTTVRHAALDGYDAVVALLLTHPRVDPTVDNNSVVRGAAFFKRDTTVALLLTDSRVRGALMTMAPLRVIYFPSPALIRLQAAIADERRWRRRRALALVREQRRAARDHAPHGPWRGPSSSAAAGRCRVR